MVVIYKWVTSFELSKCSYSLNALIEVEVTMNKWNGFVQVKKDLLMAGNLQHAWNLEGSRWLCCLYMDITQWKVTAGKCLTFSSLGFCCFETWEDVLIKKRFLLLFTVSKCCQNVWEVFPQKTLKQVKSWIYESIVAL